MKKTIANNRKFKEYRRIEMELSLNLSNLLLYIRKSLTVPVRKKMEVCFNTSDVMATVFVHIYFSFYWCRIHLWFRWMGGQHAKSMTSQRYRATYKMADMRYYGNVMTTTRWRLYIFLHPQQYSRRLNFFYLIPQHQTISILHNLLVFYTFIWTF